MFFFHFFLVLCDIQHDTLFLETNIDKAYNQFNEIHTADSQIYLYFITKVFYKDNKKAACHIFSAQPSPYFNLILSYNAYFSILYTCEYKNIADLYLESAEQIYLDYIKNKHQFKSKRLFSDLESQKDIDDTMEHVSNLITAGDTKAENVFIKLVQSGRVNPGRYEKMLKYLAEKGNAKAIGILGDMYYDGWGVEKCESTAMHYYTEGVNKKNASCFNGMGVIYRKNNDMRMAKKYFEEASKRGLSEADYNLYLLYATTYTTDDIGIGYLLSAANAGFLPAIYTYALKLHKSKNYRSATLYLCAICDYSKHICDYLENAEKMYVEKKYDSAMMYLLFAAEMGSTHALYNILYLAKKVKDIKFADKNELIYTANKKLADMGYKTNLVELGDCYYYGIGTVQSYTDAYAFYMSASLHNIAEGSYSLSYLYEHGLGTEKNLKKSIAYLLEVKNNEKGAYLLVWYVFVKLVFKYVVSILLKKEIVAGIITLIITLTYFYNKNIKKHDKNISNK